jgi:uncharacterized protein DUF4132
MSTDDGGWVPADGGYALALRGTQIVARGPRGNLLKSLPASLRDSEPVRQLRELRDWLSRHERECLATVETWMVRSLPVPSAVITSVWVDPAWQRALRDSVIRTQTDTGFLRDADPARGLGIVTLDGDTVFTSANVVTIPHPVALSELDDLRDFASDVQVEQGIAQLYRETWRKPPNLVAEALQVAEFSGGRFAQLMHATGRARSLGYQVSGGSAVTRVWEAGQLLEARYWLGSDAPEAEAWTGDLSWVDTTRGSAQRRLADVGPVAYSEGMRMAAAIYAGRIVDAAEA